MAVLKIETYPAPVLAQVAQPVTAFDKDLDRLIDDMAETLYAAPGLGLAASQVGVPKRLLVYDLTCEEGKRTGLHVLVNPKIITSDGKTVSENEGCLSVPELRADVKRAALVTVEAQDRTGKPITIDAGGLLAILLQHEIDHLNGILFLDRISRLKRDLYRRRVLKMLKSGEAE